MKSLIVVAYIRWQLTVTPPRLLDQALIPFNLEVYGGCNSCASTSLITAIAEGYARLLYRGFGPF